MIGTLLQYTGVITFLFSFLTSNITDHLDGTKTIIGDYPIKKKDVRKIHLEYCAKWIALIETFIGIILSLSESKIFEHTLAKCPISYFLTGLLFSFLLTWIIGELTLDCYVKLAESRPKKANEIWKGLSSEENQKSPK